MAERFQDLTPDVKINFWCNSDGFKEGRKTLIFIHGSGADHTNWKYQYPEMEKDFNIAAIDLPGHGKSGGNGEQTVGRYVSWIKKFIDAAQIRRPVLVGHSLGAAIGLTAAIRFGDMLSGIVSVGGGAKMPVNSLILDGLRNDTEKTISMIVKFSIAKVNRDRLAGCLFEYLSKADPDVTYGDYLSCSRLDIENELSQIKIPVLMTCGKEDKMTPPESSEFLAKNINGAKLFFIEQAGHYVMIENPDDFNRELSSFVRSI